jgi:Uma2 family endonuclease
MSVSLPKQVRSGIVYPETDGKPMAENTLQFEWIVTIKEGLETVFRDRAEVFVAGDLFWYPVEGRPDICTAPDAMVVIGRPKGHRGSYKQWEEDGVAPKAVFEVQSPGNRIKEMIEKFRFYDKYRVDEYIIYDPDEAVLLAYQRVDGELKEIPTMHGWTSPALGIKFDLSGDELKIFGPDGGRFQTYQEIAKERDALRLRADRLAAQLRAMGVEPAP